MQRVRVAIVAVEKAGSIKYFEWMSTFLHLLSTEFYRHQWRVWLYHNFPHWLITWGNIS